MTRLAVSAMPPAKREVVIRVGSQVERGLSHPGPKQSSVDVLIPRRASQHGSRRRIHQDSRLQALLSHLRNAHKRDRALPSRRTGDVARLSSAARGPRPIRVSGRADGPTRLREIRASPWKRPIHDRPQCRGGRRVAKGAATWEDPFDGLELRRRPRDRDRVEVPAEPAQSRHHGRTGERPVDGPRDAAARQSAAAEDSGRHREVRGDRGLPEPRVPCGGRRILSEVLVPPPGVAPRTHVHFGAREPTGLLHDERTERVQDHRHDQGLGCDGPTPTHQGPDPRDRRPLRRGHAAGGHEYPSRHSRFQARAVREERPLGDVGRTGPLHRGRPGFLGPRPPHMKEIGMSIPLLPSERRPRPRIETLADLVFGLSLSIGAIGLIATAPTTQSEINSHIYAFGFTFLVIITAWIIYTTFMSVLPGEVRAITFLNVALLLLVALIPYLLNSVELASPSLSAAEASAIGAYASTLFGLDLTGIMLILAAFAHVISVEERNLVAPELARLFRNGRNRLAILSLATAVSIAPQFLEWTLFGLPTRLYIWYLPLISYWVGRLVRPQSRTYRNS